MIKKLYPLSAPFEPILVNVLKYEGGYTCNKNDSGNFTNGKLTCTNKGVTGNAYKKYYGKEPTQEIIKNLTVSQVKPIYKQNYFDKIRGEEIKNDSVADLLMDIVVNSGAGMVKSFKQIMNETAGKKIVAVTSTPFTSAEIVLLNALPQDIYFKKIKDWRENFYKALVQKKPANAGFLKGWLRRLDEHKYSGAVTKQSNKGLYILGGLLLFSGSVFAGYKIA